jgi:hypothetical protein
MAINTILSYKATQDCLLLTMMATSTPTEASSIEVNVYTPASAAVRVHNAYGMLLLKNGVR